MMDRNNSLSLSIELICLLAWILKHEKHKLDGLIKKSIKGGLVQELDKLENQDIAKASEKLYTTVLDFLIYLEDSLALNLHTMQLDIKTEKNLIPALKKIQDESLNPTTIQTSIKQTTNQLYKEKETNPDITKNTDHVTQVLFKQILKNWKPSNKETMN